MTIIQMTQNIKYIQRFWDKVELLDNECWEWVATKTHNGYGSFTFKGKTCRAHRYSYQLFNGDIPKGLEIDHKCRNRSCVNPDHLESMTHKENCMRGIHLKGKSHHEGKKTHCPQGHEYTPDNIYINNGKRHCRVCRIVHNKHRYI